MGSAAARHVDHIGSFVRPPELMKAWFEEEAGKLSSAELRRITDAAIRDVVKLQEDIGLEFVTDGEFRRGGWSRGFLVAVDGFTFKPSHLTFRNEAGVSTAAPAPVATKKIKRLRPIVAEDFAFLKTVATKTAKVTMPTPSHMHFGHFSDARDKTIYPDANEYWHDLTQVYREEIADLAKVGCKFLQLDEVPLTLCCDDTNRAIAVKHGEDPDKLADTYIRVFNQAVAGRPKDMKIAVHFCRGNMQGLWMGDGGYGPIAERIFNEMDCDAFLLEYDSPRAGDFEPLKYLPKGRVAYLGLISTKKPELESADYLLRRLDEARRYADIGRLGLCPQCGFGSSAMSKFNVLPNPMTEDLERRKLGRLLEVADKVWA
ncbi:MAG: 5-methyltetrahydropteroyltriglutamate--homocysteine S-methyltransferase [Alphaproteobacteria bacterium]